MTAHLLAICVPFMLNVDHPELCAPPPPMEELCVSITNYWVWNEAGELIPWNGQADGDPGHTADMTPLSLDLEWQIAAGPLPLMGRTYVFPNGHEVRIADTFGAPAYQAGPFWHYTYDQFVWGLDVLTDEPLHYLLCEGELK